MKKIFHFIFFTLISTLLFAKPFNKNLSEEDIAKLNAGETIIKNIGYARKACLENNINDKADELISLIKDLSPKYLAEVIQFKPIEGNEDLPARLEEVLNNVEGYVGIPYYSVRHERYYDLYSSAKINSRTDTEEKSALNVTLEMEPFGPIDELFEVYKGEDYLLYTTSNLSKIRYQDKVDCFGPNKMKVAIILFKYEDNWILYGIGGVNAPHIPLLAERIETSFINRIKTFCNYVFLHL